MELGIKLSHIEERQDSAQKCYYSLKSELKKEGSITNIKKKRTTTFAKEMLEQANKHYS